MKRADNVTYDDDGNIIPLSKRFDSGEEDIRYSDRDSEGRQLSEGQQEYFKDSAVRDENGNLKVMYHGTSSYGFTVFDSSFSKYGLFGEGFYFTDNRSVAESYTQKGKGSSQGVYDVYLNITNPLDMNAAPDFDEWGKAFKDFDFDLLDRIWDAKTNEDCLRALEEQMRGEMYTKWEAGETVREIIESMGYDGVTHIGGGRFNKKDSTRHRVYITFESNQAKRTDNLKPTDNDDIRYSSREINRNLAGRSDVALYIPSTSKANYAQMIINGVKTEETRMAKTLNAFIGKQQLLTDKKYVYGVIEIGEPRFIPASEFRSKENVRKHRVPAGDDYDVKPGQKGKYAYPITVIEKYDKPMKLSESKDYQYSRQARTVLYSDRNGEVKKSSELTEADFVDLLYKVENGELDNGTYIPMRATTPQFFIDVVIEHSKGKIRPFNLPMAATVEHISQNMEEEDGQSYGNTRPHGLSKEDIVSISKEMGNPSYIVKQKNGRYSEVVSFYNSKKRKVIVAIDFDIYNSNNYLHRQYMNGYDEGHYNIIVTQYEPDSLETYLKNNEIVYDKQKMNGKYQVGSGRIVTVTHDTPFIDNNVPQGISTVNGENSLKSDRDVKSFHNDRLNSELWMLEGDKYFEAELELYSKYQSGVANKDNFFRNTVAEFKRVGRRPSGEPDYVSRNRYGEVSSEYWYRNGGVIRGSKHWGLDIRSCDWKLEGVSLKKEGVTQTSKLYGFAKWEDFVLKTEIDGAKQRKDGSYTDFTEARLTSFDDSIDALHSDREDGGLGNRTLLANALESAVQNDVERQKLEQYKAKIAQVSEQQKKLADIRQQIHDLTFQKGKRDTQRISALKDEATKTANRIAVIDGQLLKLEATQALKNVVQHERKKAEAKAKA